VQHEAFHHAYLVALATAHTAGSGGFNQNFYVVAATIIPVLFIAITLQGDIYKGLLRYWEKSAREYLSAFFAGNLTKRSMLHALTSYIAGSVAWTIVVASTFAEIIALWSLLDNNNILPPVLIALIAAGLTATVGISLIWANTQASWRLSAPYVRLVGKIKRGEITSREEIQAFLLNAEGNTPPAGAPQSSRPAVPDESGTSNPQPSDP
jgi:hypothetical protein